MIFGSKKIQATSFFYFEMENFIFVQFQPISVQIFRITVLQVFGFWSKMIEGVGQLQV